MNQQRLYRYTSNGEGIWSAGKRLLPEELVDEAWENRKWMPKPQLPDGEYRFFLTEKGKTQYEATLLNIHKKYLSNIRLEEIDRSKAGETVYEDEWQVVTKNAIPKVIQDVGFDFGWDEKKVWALELPVEEMDVSELVWHFDVPFLWENGAAYNLAPRDVIDHPDAHRNEYERTMNADTTYPIDIMENKGRWLILDGLHRLMKSVIIGARQVRVRKVPRDRIPDILE